jgi:hypothetical protein
LEHGADEFTKDASAVLQVLAFGSSGHVYGCNMEASVSISLQPVVVSDGELCFTATMPVTFTVKRGALVPSPDLREYVVVSITGYAHGCVPRGQPRVQRMKRSG